MTPNLSIMIVGAGTGGLCLAHGLKGAGLDVRVFERDTTPTDRLQGYRLHISAIGNRALKRCLSPEVFEGFARASAISNTAVSFFDSQLNRLLRIAIAPREPGSIASERPISRIALRKILLEGLDEHVTFGRTFTHYELLPGGRVAAHFQDGSSASGDVLIGADGASSRVRGQLLPLARRSETGIAAISGKFSLNDSVKRSVPAAVFDGPTLVLGPHGCFLFASAVEYPPGADRTFDGDEYVMWGFSAPKTDLSGGHNLNQLSGAQAKALVLAQLKGWAPALVELVERADPETMTTFDVKSANPVNPWPTGRVTLLGDALHNMTPFRGMGANMALRDAGALCDALVKVDRQQENLISSLAAYEREMIDTGFAAVNSSLAEMRRLHSRSSLSRLFLKIVFRLADTIRPLQILFRK
jgi:2-polyprenyl-6-methoxyphenol hydroxylase-like FAD-dependent oxidoreductase